MIRKDVSMRALRLFGLVGAGLLPACASNVNDLLGEARRGDPESVREAVVDLGTLLQRKEEGGYPFDEADAEAILYLKDVARKSSDPLNRARAITSLGLLRRPRLTDVYLESLNDKSWIVQLEAAKALAANPDPAAAEPLARHMEGEHRMEVRLDILRALEASGGEPALRAVLEVFLDRSSRFKDMKIAAYDAARSLSGKDYPFEDSESWQMYYEERFPRSDLEAKPEAAPRTTSGPAGAREGR